MVSVLRRADVQTPQEPICGSSECWHFQMLQALSLWLPPAPVPSSSPHSLFLQRSSRPSTRGAFKTSGSTWLKTHWPPPRRLPLWAAHTNLLPDHTQREKGPQSLGLCKSSKFRRHTRTLPETLLSRVQVPWQARKFLNQQAPAREWKDRLPFSKAVPFTRLSAFSLPWTGNFQPFSVAKGGGCWAVLYYYYFFNKSSPACGNTSL